MTTKTSPSTFSNRTSQNTRVLSRILADTYITYLKTQNFHWNVIDPRFQSLHKMFEGFYEELAESIDELAERIRMLKEKSPATMREFLELTSLDEPRGELSGDEMLESLLKDREAIIEFIKPRIEEVIKTGDQGTGDLLIQHLRMHEKAAWMYRSSI